MSEPKSEVSRRRVLKKSAVTGSLIIGGTSAIASQSVAAEQKPEIFHEDLVGMVIECDGTTLTVTQGSFQTVIREGEDSSDGIHLIAEGNAKSVKAEDDAGTPYTLNGGFWAELNAKGDNATFTITETFHALGRGDAKDFRFEAVTHITVVDGEITVEFMKGGGDCLP
jgi:hypothetical protein